MNINYFFLIVGLGLLGILIAFRPMEIAQSEKQEVALLDLTDFSVYELGQGGLQSIMKGSAGERYEDRYDVEDANYTDNTQAYVQNITSDFARYRTQADVILLNKHVHYERADGLIFTSNEAIYNQKKGTAKTKGPFTVMHGENRVDGIALHYNSHKDTIKAKKVNGVYTLHN